MLRAVLSLDECQHLVSQHEVTYLGQEFPSLAENGNNTHDFAVLGFRSEEAGQQWQPGYYRLDSDLSLLNDELRVLSR